jgi:hypothetical protein
LLKNPPQSPFPKGDFFNSCFLGKKCCPNKNSILDKSEPE